ncbi:hypothetical protein [uncultured Psychroserpens sp.]|uniref:hypothetical protein n=1 Tax=uncultured Psychroserpens sp. TaxID=255436 RepID=UPI0026133AAB|nr:hypothetical protein [uncultured Psychroserpens sp.]
MKKRKTLNSLFVCMLLIFSCETEDISTQDQTLTNSKTNTSEVYARDGSGGGVDILTDAEILENHLQWVSFIAAEIILYHPDAREEFLAKLDVNGTVALEELIGNDMSMGGSFRDTFDQILYYHVCIDIFGQCGKPGSVSGTPNRPASSSNGTGGGGILPGFEVEWAVADFRNFVLSQNCIELHTNYNSVLVGAFIVNDMTSTAHPLNTDDSNIGIRRYSQLGTQPILSVDNAYMATNLTLIARPFRPNAVSIGDECSYTEYSDVADFTDFPQ